MPTLQALAHSRHRVVAVVTQPPKPVGRRKVLTATPVQAAAEGLGVPVFSPLTETELLDVVHTTAPDIAIVVAYGRILGNEVLESIAGGWWNIHFSQLPQWRGAAPVQRALLAGDANTGITLFRIVEALDAGPVATSQSFPIAPHDTAGTLLSKLGDQAPSLVLEFLESCAAGTHETSPQQGTPTLAPKLSAQDAQLDPTLPSEEIYRRFRASTPEPGATLFRTDDRQAIKIRQLWIETEVQGLAPGELKQVGDSLVMGTADAGMVLERVQPSGKREMTGLEWFRGLPPGVTLTCG